MGKGSGPVWSFVGEGWCRCAKIDPCKGLYIYTVELKAVRRPFAFRDSCYTGIQNIIKNGLLFIQSVLIALCILHHQCQAVV